jgi:hypothetical protein
MVHWEYPAGSGRRQVLAVGAAGVPAVQFCRSVWRDRRRYCGSHARAEQTNRFGTGGDPVHALQRYVVLASLFFIWRLSLDDPVNVLTGFHSFIRSFPPVEPQVTIRPSVASKLLPIPV